MDLDTDTAMAETTQAVADRRVWPLAIPGPLGKQARALYATQVRDLERCIGTVWDKGKPHRAIYDAIQIDTTEPAAFYACYPFRIVQYEGATWIGGAIGCPRLMDRPGAWGPTDVIDLILWNPKTGKSKVAGETTFLCEPQPCEELTVYADPKAFFRAWAERRAEAVMRRDMIPRMPDSDDSWLPGAFVTGSLARIRWPAWARTIRAGPGVDAKQLRSSVLRNSPRVI